MYNPDGNNSITHDSELKNNWVKIKIIEASLWVIINIFFRRDMKFPACLSCHLDLIHFIDIQKSGALFEAGKGNFGAMKHSVTDSRKKAIVLLLHVVFWFGSTS